VLFCFYRFGLFVGLFFSFLFVGKDVSQKLNLTQGSTARHEADREVDRVMNKKKKKEERSSGEDGGMGSCHHYGFNVVF